MSRPRSLAWRCRWMAAGPPISGAPGKLAVGRVTAPRADWEERMLDVLGAGPSEGETEYAACGSDPAQRRRQIVLVFQGGGALGAYQAGVYQALHESGVEPDWIIGTSIGAIN